MTKKRIEKETNILVNKIEEQLSLLQEKVTFLKREQTEEAIKSLQVINERLEK